MKNKYECFKVYIPVIFYFLLDAYIFLPTVPITKINKGFIGAGNDPYGLIWVLSHFNEVLESKTTMFFSKKIFFVAYGTELFSTALIPLISFLSLPFQRLGGLLFFWNLWIFTGVLISGISMYLLSLYLTKSQIGSLIAGAIYMLVPSHLFGIEVINLKSIQFLPLFILSLFKLYNSNDKKYATLAASLLYMNILIGYQEFAFCIFFFIIWFLFYFFKSSNKVKFITNFSLICLIFGLLSSTYLLPIFGFVYREFENPLMIEYANLNNLKSVDFVSFIKPPSSNRILKIFIENKNPSQIEYVYLGCIPLLSLLWNLYRRKNIFWLIVFFISTIIVIGPYPRFGTFFLDFSFLWKWVAKLPPLLFLLHHNMDFSTLQVLSLCILSSFFLSEISKKIKRKKWTICLLFVLTIMVIIEYPIYIPFTVKKIPKIFLVLRSNDKNFSILEVPPIPYDTFLLQKSMFYQTFHKKPLILGHLSRIPSRVYLRIRTYEVLRHVAFGMPLTKDLNYYKKEITQLKKDYNLKYIIFEKGNVYPGIDKELVALVNKISTMKKIYEDEEVLVFQIR